jgi:flavin reductase (DIM6/NTAB) family NADH-FMN oxidoreductase RutF
MNKIMNLSNKAIKSIENGSFLVCGDKSKPNIMTIGWSTFGVMWGKPVIAVPVRFSRYSHVLMESGREFTVSFPSPGELKEEIMVCGTKSGRDLDKVKQTGLTIEKSNRVGIGNIKECPLVFECKVIAKMDLSDETFIDGDYLEQWYPNENFHTIYYGEILDVYER